MIGRHTVKFWSKTQQNITLSTAEAELVALVKGACEGIGIGSLLKDMGQGANEPFDIYTDAEAAMGMVQREGSGRTRHIDVGILWIQQKAKLGVMEIGKIDTKWNVADIVTKPVPSEILWKHTITMGFELREGRAEASVELVDLESSESANDEILNVDVHQAASSR